MRSRKKCKLYKSVRYTGLYMKGPFMYFLFTEPKDKLFNSKRNGHEIHITHRPFDHAIDIRGMQ